MAEIDPVEFRLEDYRRILGRQRWIVIAIVVLCVGLALGLSLVQTPRYRASAEILVGLAGPASQASPGAVDQNTLNQIEVIKGDGVRDAVTEDLQEVAPITVTARSGADIIRIVATSDDAESAAATANAYAQSYLDELDRRAAQASLDALAAAQAHVDQLDDQRRTINRRLEQIRTNLSDPTPATPVDQLRAERAERQQRLASIEATRAVLLATMRQRPDARPTSGQTTATLARAATVPAEPFRPKTMRNVLVALVTGVLIGIGAALLRHRFDNTLHTRNDLERAAGLPVLACVPRPAESAGSAAEVVTLDHPQSPASEAYRLLRAAVRVAGASHQPHVVAVTSAGAGEGKTTTVANLAVVLAQAGRRVLALDGDLRRPRLHQFFGLDNDRGFSTAQGESDISGFLQPVAKIGGLRVMTSGEVPVEPGDLLASAGTDGLFQELAPHFDVIVVDAPPVLPVSDALELSHLVDSVLLVATAGSSSRTDVALAVERLMQVGAPLIGAVLNRADTGTADAYQEYAPQSDEGTT